MNNIVFEYKINLNHIILSNTNLDTLDIFELKNFFNGHIYIFFNIDDKKKRNFIVLSTGILDYIKQFDNLIIYLDKGNKESFTVSSDFYSNSLNYIYTSEKDILEIQEVNSLLFNINCRYKDFKKVYKKFRKNTLDELILLFPKLEQNLTFKEYFIDNNFTK